MLCLLKWRREVGVSAESRLEGRGWLGQEGGSFEWREEVLFARRGWGMLMDEWLRLLILLRWYHCWKRITHSICLSEIRGIEVVIILGSLLFRRLRWSPEILFGSWRILCFCLICNRWWLKYCEIICALYLVALGLLITLSKYFRIAAHCLWWSILKTLTLGAFIKI